MDSEGAAGKGRMMQGNRSKPSAMTADDQSLPVTVVVPVRDRATTIGDTLRSCEAQSDGRFRVLVSDNFSDDGTAEVVDEFVRRDTRFKLVQPPEPMAMTQHWSWLIDQVEEGWVMLLGADDGLLPDSLETLAAISSKHPDVESISGGFAVYYYPDLPTENAGELSFSTRRRLKIVDGKSLLEGAASFSQGPDILPLPYAKSFVKTSVLDRIRNRGGTLISSPTPDYYLGIAIASEAKLVAVSSRPLALAGISSAGNGAKCLFPEMGNALDTALAFVNDGSVKWHSSVPYAPYIQFAVAEAIVQAKSVGIVAEETVIRWDRCIAQSYAALTAGSWEEADRVRIVESLLQACRKFCSNDLESKILQRVDPGRDPLLQSLLRVAPASEQYTSFRTAQLGTANVWHASELISVFLKQLDATNESAPGRLRRIASRLVRKIVSISTRLRSRCCVQVAPE